MARTGPRANRAPLHLLQKLMNAPAPGECELCEAAGGTVLWRDDRLRVVAVENSDYPGFTRVIWNEHVREWSDLDEAARARLLHVLFLVERAIRQELAPDKMNLASLGNQVPHLHWHLVPRYRDDAHFPQPIWAAQRREPDAAALELRRARLPALWKTIACTLSGPPGDGAQGEQA